MGASREEELPHPLVASLEFSFPKSPLIPNVYGNPFKVTLQISTEDYSCKHFYQPTIREKSDGSVSYYQPVTKLILGWGE